MTTTHTATSLEAFLTALFSDSDGLIELRALPSRAQQFVRLGNEQALAAFLHQHRDENTYFGVASRCDATSGALQNCRGLGALFADFDFKSTPESEVRARLTTFPLAATIVVQSGHGLHVYWLLREALDLSTEAALARSLLRRLASYFGADLTAAEPARILRLPGTRNFKYAPPRPVRIESFNNKHCFNPTDFDLLLPEEPGGNGDERSKPFCMPGKVREGERNATLYRLGRSLAARGLSGEEILATLRTVNQARCESPLPDEEVATIAAHVTTQADRPEFQSAHREDGIAAETLAAINAGDKQMPRLAEAAWLALLAANAPPVVFRFGGLPARIERDDSGMPVMRPLTLDRLQHRLARVAHWFALKFDKKTDDWIKVDALPPLHLGRDLLARPEPPLPVLTRIVEAPVFAGDGTLTTTAGYHPASQSYYAPAAGFTVPTVPGCPSAEDLGRARRLLLDELLVDFPFVRQAERANALALLLLPFVRELIHGATPLHLIEKPSPGTGASLLADVLLFPATGRRLATLTEGRDEDEWRKRLTAKLLSGTSVILIDNLRRRLESSAVSAALTASLWEDRRLGETDMVRIPVRCAWVATGNNPGLSAEITRRSVRIRLDAKVDRPWLREGFRHPDLRGWLAEHRGELVWAALVLARYWLVMGQPRGDRVLGMFEDWARTIGGILAATGIDGFLDNLDEFYDDSDAEGAAWRIFVAAWWERHQDQTVGVAELWKLVAPDDGDPIDLGLGDGNERSLKTRLGKQLGQMRDRQFDQWRVVKAKERNRAQHWRLVPVEQ